SEIRGREIWSDFCHELHELTRRQKFDSCKLVKFVAERAAAIEATKEARFLQGTGLLSFKEERRRG
ncbi:MAG: hypothetical protein WA077_18965, partial [Anaerolineae bacterium]